MPDAQNQNAFKQLCVPQNLVRSNYYSDTYRASCTLNGVEQTVDIQFIRIPFEESKEKMLVDRFGYSEIELKEFYATLSKQVKRHLMYTQELANLKQDNINTSTAFYLHRQVAKNEEEHCREIFIVTRPMESLIGSSVISGEGAYMFNILQLGVRLLQTAKSYHDAGYHIGAFDLESMYSVDNNGKTLVKNGGFLSASKASEGGFGDYTAASSAFLDIDVANGTAPASFDSDVRSICRQLWTLCNGNYYTTAADTAYRPQYADDALTELLQDGLTNGAAAYAALGKGLRRMAKDMAEGKAENPYISFEQPKYVADMKADTSNRKAEGEKAAKEAEKEARRKKAEEIRNKSKKKDDGKKRSALTKDKIFILILILAAIVFCIFQFLGSFSPVPSEPVAEEVTPAPAAPVQTQPPVAATPVPAGVTTSADKGLYRGDGYIVDYYGRPTTRFYVDDSGNIVHDPSALPARLEDLEYTDNIIDLDEAGIECDLDESELVLTRSQLTDGGITPDTLLTNAAWDTSRHMRKIGTAYMVIPATKNSEEQRVELSDETFRLITSGAADEEIIASLTQQMLLEHEEELGYELDADQKDEFCKDNTATAKSLLKSCSGYALELVFSDWYEEYRNIDNDTYNLMALVAREPECGKIKSRESTVNGSTITLYYDDEGNTYTENDWLEQEQLISDIASAKAILDYEAGVTEPVTDVPAEGVMDYVYVEDIRFSRNPYENGLNTNGRNILATDYVITVKVLPENATCKEVLMWIDKDSGLMLPYKYNADPIIGTYGTYDTLTAAQLNFGVLGGNELSLVFTGNAYGDYEVTFRSADKRTEEVLQVQLSDGSPVIDDAPVPTPVPTTAPASTPSGNTGGSGYYGGSPTYTQPTQTPAPTPTPTPTPTPEPTPVPTQEPITPVDPEPTQAPAAAEFFVAIVLPDGSSTTGNYITLHIGECAELKPQDNCTWSASSTCARITRDASYRPIIEAVSEGTCVFTAYTNSGLTYTITVNVVP